MMPRQKLNSMPKEVSNCVIIGVITTYTTYLNAQWNIEIILGQPLLNAYI